MGNTTFRRSPREVSEAQNEGNEDLSTAVPDCIIIKGLDANKYATKKTVAQGMLDIALLTSNASQLKYVLQVGPRHEFYTLLITLISVSLVLQVLMGLVLLSLNLLRDCRLHLPDYNESANFINYFTTGCAFVVTVLNATAGILTLTLSLLNQGGDRQKEWASILYHISVGLITCAIFCDVIKMTFGLDPALSTVTSGVMYSILASSLNINKPTQQRKADILNNICLSLNVVVLAVNVLIGVFYMLEQKE